MARFIHCEKCAARMAAHAKKYGELYESIKGTAKKDMFCDAPCGKDGPTPIKAGDTCHAAVLLPSKKHPGYAKQKPSVWASELIKPDNQ